MLAISPDRAIDPQRIELLGEVSEIVGGSECTFFIIGALARDILLTGVFGIETGRATLDVDLGVVVKDWATFEAIKHRFVETKRFSSHDKRPHRLFYLPTGIPLDLVPFGGVEQPSTRIAWPPDQAFVMNVAGYQEALDSAVEVQVAHELTVRVASLPGLSILKVFAWDDRGAEDPKDAIDLGTILRKYNYAGNEDRLYEDISLLETLSYDVDLVGARLLGRDAAGVASEDTKRQLLTLLNDGRKLDRLALDVARGLRGVEDAYDLSMNLLSEFRNGIGEK